MRLGTVKVFILFFPFLLLSCSTDGFGIGGVNYGKREIKVRFYFYSFNFFFIGWQTIKLPEKL